MPGIVPDPILGPIVDFINGRRSFVNAIGARPAPGGPTFHRPVLTDALPTAGQQTAEKTELSMGLMTIARANVSMETYGRYANISRQLEGYSNPGAAQVIINALSRSYARATEEAAVDAVEASTATVDYPMATNNSAAVLIDAVYAAAEKYFNGTGELPTYLLVGADGWRHLGSMTDLNERQILPFLAPSNAAGQMSADSFNGNPLGLQLVVSYAVTAGRMVVGGAESQEFYERLWGEMSVVEPSVVGRQVSVSGDFGIYLPDATKAPVVLKDTTP
jgi:hypothetical protein